MANPALPDGRRIAHHGWWAYHEEFSVSDDPDALVRGEKTRVKAILQQGLDSAEHADFVARLERARIA